MSNPENGNAPPANNAHAAAVANTGRGRNFTFIEDSTLNDCYEEYDPISSDEREMACRMFQELFQLHMNGELTTHTAKSLYARFTRMKNHPMGTGDPECPENVKGAKRIYCDIMAKAGGRNGGEEREEALALEDVPAQEAAAEEEAENGEAENEGNAEGNAAPVAHADVANDYPPE